MQDCPGSRQDPQPLGYFGSYLAGVAKEDLPAPSDPAFGSYFELGLNPTKEIQVINPSQTAAFKTTFKLLSRLPLMLGGSIGAFPNNWTRNYSLV
jgi:hypothetical protein